MAEVLRGSATSRSGCFGVPRPGRRYEAAAVLSAARRSGDHRPSPRRRRRIRPAGVRAVVPGDARPARRGGFAGGDRRRVRGSASEPHDPTGRTSCSAIRSVGSSSTRWRANSRRREARSGSSCSPTVRIHGSPPQANGAAGEPCGTEARKLASREGPAMVVGRMRRLLDRGGTPTPPAPTVYIPGTDIPEDHAAAHLREIRYDPGPAAGPVVILASQQFYEYTGSPGPRVGRTVAARMGEPRGTRRPQLDDRGAVRPHARGAAGGVPGTRKRRRRPRSRRGLVAAGPEAMVTVSRPIGREINQRGRVTWRDGSGRRLTCRSSPRLFPSFGGVT